MHRDKKSRIYLIKISFLWNNQEFSSASFPHVFKAIGPLENNLETKKHFFSPFKKVTFSVSRILHAKTTKNDVFLTHFLNIDFIWGKSRFLKIVFLPFVSSMKIHDFHWKYCLSVLWWFWDFFISTILQTNNIPCFEVIILPKKLFWNQKTRYFYPN